MTLLDETEAEALYVVSPLGVSADKILGIITVEDIEQHYRPRPV